MKKVLIISGSPRKGGNSDTLCDRFLDGAKEAGNEVEKIFLNDRHINYCTGCGACNTTHRCVQKDDMAEILEKMVAADVIVLATPVYFYSAGARLKTLIDRTCPRYTEISGKTFYFIAAMAEDDRAMMERTFDCLRGFLDCLDSPTEAGVIAATGVWKKGEIEKTGFPRQAYEAGKSI